MSNVQIINYLKIIIVYLIIIILGIIIIKIMNLSLLKINTAEVIKTDLFKIHNSNEQYYNYMNIFENYILNNSYEKAYSLLDDYNAKEKFSGINDFRNKMNFIYDETKNHNYMVAKVNEKENYKDIYIKTNITYKDISNTQISVVEFMIREYNTFDYKIYVRTNMDI